MPYEFQITRRVEFSDTDMAGIMHFSNFFRFMETAEHAFMRSIGLSVDLCKHGVDLHLPRVHAECDYLAPLHFEDEVCIHLVVEKKGTRSLTYRFLFSRLTGSVAQEVARGRITVVCTALQSDGTMKAVPLPKIVTDQIQQAPASMLADVSSRTMSLPPDSKLEQNLKGIPPFPELGTQLPIDPDPESSSLANTYEAGATSRSSMP